ncbi:hypothetical protein [Phytohalomonas tamaricis]|uniref:hypothetical protein n=1 Tax=Phytohalomonas tamaricis TaxID=2081032 RepID=UPI000D0B0E81|nr:hypothetical protein [Phytohalomonas tamaricis]
MPLFIVYQEYVTSAYNNNKGSTATAFRINAIEDDHGNDLTHQLDDLDISFAYRDDQSGHALLKKQIADSLDLEMQDIELEFFNANG